MEGSEQMRRLGEDAQEAFASGNPDTLGESEDELMEVCNSTFNGSCPENPIEH